MLYYWVIKKTIMKNLIILVLVIISLASCKEEETILDKMQGEWFPLGCNDCSWCDSDKIKITDNVFTDYEGTNQQSYTLFESDGEFLLYGAGTVFTVVEVNETRLVLNFLSFGCDNVGYFR